MLLLTGMILIAKPLLASAFVIDPAAILQTWWETNHWPGITAAALLTSMIVASWRMPPVKNETKAIMVSDLFRTCRYIVIALLFIEFYDFITLAVMNLIDFIGDLF